MSQSNWEMEDHLLIHCDFGVPSECIQQHMEDLLLIGIEKGANSTPFQHHFEDLKTTD